MAHLDDRIDTEMTFNKNTLVLTASALLAVLGVFGVRHIAASHEMNAQMQQQRARESGIVRFAPNAPQLASIRVAAAEEVALPASAPVNGRIAYDENVTARVSSPVLGRVTRIAAEVGDHVDRNSALALIDSPDLASADADWRKAQADEKRKKLAFDRAKALLDHDVIARKDFESAQADFEQAAVETRRAALRMKNLNASGAENGSFRLKAPIPGVIADRQINPGLEVRPDLPNPLFTITDLRRLWVLADVPERSIANIRPGQKVAVQTDAYDDRQFNATVERIGLALDPATHRVQVRCSIDNPDGALKPDMFARLYFVAGQDRKAVRIPNDALVADGLYHFVFVEKSPGVFEKRRVALGLKDSTVTYVTGGLRAGERFVTEGALLLNSEAASDAQ